MGGGANLFFWTVCLRRSFGDLRDIQLSTHECRLAVPFMSGHRLCAYTGSSLSSLAHVR